MFIKVSNLETDQSNFTGLTSKLETTCPVRIKLGNPPSDSNDTTRNVAIICALFVVELVSGAMAFYALLKKYIKYRDMAQSVGLELVQAGGPKRFGYEELKTATKDFSDVVGHGGFGVVYKGTLPDGRVVAVKRLKSFGFGAGNNGGNETQFWAEVTIIARMHHLNLVRMWGFCADKSQRLLVYEYIPNGSLDKFLFPSKTPPHDSTITTTPPPLVLDLKMRYRISLGVARAIAYLHEECLEWVLHCDIKPENILLENDFCPKVSDFGLAKLAKKEDMVSMSRMRGTRGYMAPEWVRMEPITAKADVYSYGIVLLEMVSGVRSMEFKSGEGVDSEDWYFPRWVYEKLYEERRVEEIVDCRMFDGIGDEEMGMVDRMVKTAMWCLQDRAEMRPSMGRVAKMLEGSVEIADPGKPTIFYLGSE
ncbi:hypothetical protein Sjap_014847 [Stephania japonica]|uniref:Protein kinase domain-containing protein n=1 Tax=Stephania japonica TaxID=461633 RepID=A0AAP0NSB0_9MAGN